MMELPYNPTFPRIGFYYARYSLLYQQAMEDSLLRLWKVKSRLMILRNLP